ncbi:RNA interference and silencing protein [Xylogone sp. PMI_703]|nr:RNA interference and silencing protein [Xylogone sp. PMI_703]
MSYDQRGRGRGRGGRGGDRGGGPPRGGDRGGRGGRGGGPPGGDRGGGFSRGGGDSGRGSFRGDRGDRGGRGGRGDGGFRGGRGGAGSGVFRDGKYDEPNTKVSQLEDDFMRQRSTLEGQLSGISLKQQFPIRPGYGTQGTKVVLWANYYDFTVKPGVVLYRYDVKVSPEEKGGKLRQLFRLLMKEQQLSNCITDFGAIVISRKKFDNLELQLLYRSEGEDEPRPNASPHTVRIDYTGSLDVSGLLSYLGKIEVDPNFTEEKRLEITQGLNILMGHVPRSNPEVSTTGANRHFPIGGTKHIASGLGGGLVALRGYIRSARQATGRMLLNVQIKHAAFFRPGPLTALIDEFGNAYGRNIQELERFLSKVRIEATHIPPKKNGSPKPKTIVGLARKEDGFKLPKNRRPQVNRHGALPKDVKFWYDKGNNTKGPESGYITVSDYFQRVWNKTPNPNYPVVNTGTRDDPKYLPADMCNVLPGQVAVKKLSPEQTKNMIQFACRRPFLNADSITNDSPSVLGFSDPLLKSYDISVDSLSLITVPGRILRPPQLKYRTSTSNPTDGSWNMRGVKFAKCQNKVPQWTCMWINRRGQNGRSAELTPILENFSRVMGDSGLTLTTRIDGPVIEIIKDNDSGTIGGREYFGREYNEKLISETIGKIAQRNCELVFVLLNDTEAYIYNAVKKAADITHGIHSICAIYSKVRKASEKGSALDQYLANIALKVNSKLRGSNQTLDTKKLGIIGEGKTMVVGIDVTHPSPGSSKDAPSVSSVVASTSGDLSQFPGVLGVQSGRTEMVSALAEMIKTRIAAWKKNNGNAAPENILVYRDGVSEGQYGLVLENELPGIRKACNGEYTPAQVKRGLPKISIIIVGKRHNTRFYPVKQEDADRSSNPKNGTVVDRGVTSMWNWDFFLQAHTCLQGTAKPAHYYVVLDEIFGNKPNLKAPHPFPNPADSLEDLTHNMCYLFARATKAVSICPPAYYADLACTRARCYLDKAFDPSGASTVTGGTTYSSQDVTIHPKLRDTMFYL